MRILDFWILSMESRADVFFYMHCALIPIDYVDTGYGRVLEISC